MHERLSTREVGWILGKSSGSVRRMIRDGEIDGMRVPGGFHIPKAEVLRVARERIEAEGRPEGVRSRARAAHRRGDRDERAGCLSSP